MKLYHIIASITIVASGATFFEALAIQSACTPLMAALNGCANPVIWFWMAGYAAGLGGLLTVLAALGERPSKPHP